MTTEQKIIKTKVGGAGVGEAIGERVAGVPDHWRQLSPNELNPELFVVPL